MGSILDRVKKMKDTKASGGGRRYIDKEGEHYFLVMGVREDQKQDTTIGIFGVDVRLVKTTNPAEMKLGAQYDWAAFEDQKTYLANVKNFLCAAFGVDEADLDEMPEEDLGELIGMAIGVEQSVAGKVLLADAKPSISKGKGKIPKGETYYVPTWKFVEPEEQKRILAEFKAGHEANGESASA